MLSNYLQRQQHRTGKKPEKSFIYLFTYLLINDSAMRWFLVIIVQNLTIV